MDQPETLGAPSGGPSPIDEHVQCLRCGYNLHGLDRSGVCPECGTEVERTLDGNLLRYSSSAYIRTLGTGILLIVLSYVLSLAALVVALPIGIAVVFSAGFTGTMPDHWWLLPLIIVGAVFGLGVGVLSLVGWWKFSEPDPDFVGNDTAHGYRLSLRILVVIFAIMMIVSLPFDIMIWTTESFAIEMTQMALGWITGILGVVMFFVSLLYVRVVATRIPDRTLVNRTKTYLWLLPVIYIVGACIVVGPIVATVMYLFLLWNVRKHLVAILNQLAPDAGGPAVGHVS